MPAQRLKYAAVFAFATALVLCVGPASAQSPNRVLDLDGDSDAVRLPTELFAGLDEVTVEAWVRWQRFADFSQPFGFGRAWQGIFLNNRSNTSDLQFYAYLSRDHLELIAVPDILRLGTWHHIATVAARDRMRLYLDGVLVGERTAAILPSLDAEANNLLGGAHWPGNADFAGQLDEVRVWRTVRTQAQIRRDMHRRLKGSESGLLALWNFDGGDVRDSGPHHLHGTSVGDAHTVLAELPPQAEHTAPISLSGLVRDEVGRALPNALVQLYHDGIETRQTRSNGEGYYQLSFRGERVDLAATHDEQGTWREGLHIAQGTKQRIDLDLQPAISIAGRLQALDGSAHTAMPVQALRRQNPPGAALRTTASSTDGFYRFINLRPGQYRLRVLTPDGPLYYATDLSVGARENDAADFRFAPFKKGTWKAYTTRDGLTYHGLHTVHRTADGTLWTGSFGGGLFRFDGHAFQQLTTRHGLVDNFVRDLYEDDDGALWIATRAGVSRLVHGIFTNLTSASHGLPSDNIQAITRSKDGALWIGTSGAGLVRCQVEIDDQLSCAAVDDARINPHIWSLLAEPDGTLWIGTNSGLLRYSDDDFTAFNIADGLPGQLISALHRDREGLLWVGTSTGLARYDGTAFTSLTTEDGLPNNMVNSIHRDEDGLLWVGTGTGLARIDANAWPTDGLHIANFSAADGLAANSIADIHRDIGGALWVAGGGLTRYDAEGLLHFATADGLPDNSVLALHRDEDKVLWAATGGGVARIEKNRIVSYDKSDGLPDDIVYAVHRTADGDLWLGTANGVARFDGTHFSVFDHRQGLFAGGFTAIEDGPDSSLWVAHGFGVYTYNGKAFTRFTEADGLPSSRTLVHTLFRDHDGTMWVGTDAGLFRYDGTRFISFGDAEGLTDRPVYALFRDDDGILWIGTSAGLSRYDGTHFASFDAEDGLTGGAVYAIAQAPWGPLCLGTAGGLCLFDGESWSTLDRRDGLVGDRIGALLVEGEGDLWLGSEGGLTRYRHQRGQPQVRIRSLQIDRLHSDLDALPPLTTGTRITLRYDALDLSTHTGQHQYRRRVVAADGTPLLDWHNTGARALDITFAEADEYTFEVMAISRDLEYSPIAALALTVVPPWYARLWVVSFAGGGLVALIASSLFYARRYSLQRRETRQLRERMLDQERSARTALEEAYLEVQRLLRIEERTAVILRGWAHAVKSPLTIIRRQLAHSNDDELPARVETIVGTVDRILGAAVDVQPRHFDLRSELNLLLYRTVQQYPSVKMQNHGSGAVRIYADHAKLVMAFENLFHNACQALGGEGAVQLTIEEQARHVRIEVADDGPGIPDEIRARLFEHTVTTRKNSGGTGLGLLITQHVIDAHGGRIWIETTSAKGTTFCVELPRGE